VLQGGAAGWPDGGKLAVLRLWPSIRAGIGVRLQTAASLGVQRAEIVAMLPGLLTRAHRWSPENHVLAEDLVRDFIRYFGRDVGRYFGRDVVRYFGRDLVRYFSRDVGRDVGRYFGRDVVRDFVWDLVREFGQYFGRDFGRDFGRYLVRDFGRDVVRDFVRNFVRDFVRYFARDRGFSETALTAPWLPTLAILELGSVAGRASPRAALAHGEVREGVPLLALFRAACRASFAPGDASLREAATSACDAFDGDPLWPALARHIARISTTEDRALLVELARHPQRREPPLSWGLQHYVRGDLVLDGDSIVTLDELCAEAGLEPLPLLEDMADELEIAL
jgi:hypothetical protein